MQARHAHALPASSDKSASFGPARTGPVTRGATLVVLFRREQPLDAGEHQALTDAAARWTRRPWSRLALDELVGLEGMGSARVLVRVTVLASDPEGTELNSLAELLGELRATVPGASLQARDPLALLGVRDGRVLVEGRHLLPALPADFAVPKACRLAGPPPPDSLVDTVAPGTQAELFDLLEAVQASPAERPVAALGLSFRHLPGLREALFSGIRPGAACRLLTLLADRELSDRPALIEGARALLGDGDASERQAARALLDALGAPDAQPGQDSGDGPGLELLPRLGRLLLSSPGLEPELEDDSGQLPPESDDDDDLDLSELLLDDEPPADPLDAAIADLLEEEPAAVAALARLAATGGADFSRRASARLDAEDESAAAACALIVVGAWPAARLPGWHGQLSSLARSTRPWPVRALALRALGRAGGPDATQVLLEAMSWQPDTLAAAAVRALAGIPGARARGAVRGACDRTELALPALLALGEARDTGAFERALQLAGHDQPRIRAVAAETAATLGGSRALPTLETLLVEEAEDSVHEAAARALGRCAPPQRVRELITDQAPGLGAAALRAAGQAGRIRLFPLLLSASRHPHPELRQAAAEAMGALGLPAATPRLLELMLDEDVPTALAALDALGTAGDHRAVRLLRLLAAHPGLPGKRASAVLRSGRWLRRPAPDNQLRVRARAPRAFSTQVRGDIARAFVSLPLRIRLGDQQLAGEGLVDPWEIDALADLAAALDAVDAAVPGLVWSVRDPQGLLRRGPSGWSLGEQDPGARIQRSAGWWSPEAPRVQRVPLAAEVVRRVPDPGAADALPVGAGEPDDPLLPEHHDEDIDDDATEQTISGFLEEITGQEQPVAEPDPVAASGGAPPPRKAPPPHPPAAPPPRHTGRQAAPPQRQPSQGMETADGLEELLFDPGPEPPSHRRDGP